MSLFSLSKIKDFLKCKLCWQLSISLFITILIAELIILFPFYLSFRSEQFNFFEQKQIQAAKTLLHSYVSTNKDGTQENRKLRLLLLQHSDIRGLTIYNADGSILASFGKRPQLSPVDFESIKAVSKEFYKKDPHHFYALWNQTELEAPYEIVAIIKSSPLTHVLQQFIRGYWDEALILLLVMTLTTLIISYLLLLRPIKNAYLTLTKHDLDATQLRITQLPNNELGFIFTVINNVFAKLGQTILELKDRSKTITHLNKNLESTVEQRTKQLNESNKALKAMALLPEENSNPVFRASAKGEILYFNPASANLFAFWDCSKTLMLPQSWSQVIKSILESRQNKQLEVNIDKKIYLLEFAPISSENYVNVYGLDITEQKLSEKENKFLHNHNQTTKLYNKRAFKLLLEEKIKQSPPGFACSLWFIQANDIVNINQNLGYTIGDEFLYKIATLLEKSKPDRAILGHFNQNIFVLSVFATIDLDTIDGIASRIISLFDELFLVQGHKLRTSSNLGISLYPNDTQEIDELFKHADMALLQAIAKGPNSFHFYTEEINQKISTHHKIYQGLHDAVFQKELVLYYQPQLDLSKNKITGVEALIRWQHPEQGLISPNDFIEVLEKSSLIFDVTPWLFETAAKQLAKWHKQGINDIKIAVNLSAQQLLQKNLLEILQHNITHYSINPRDIEIEITERISLSDPERVISILNDIQTMGFEIALDDFGTDYSSLTYLQKLPINKLKIDKGFTDNITDSDENRNIVKMIIQLAKELNFSTITEGVETEKQKLLLTQLGCNEIQGYLVSKPLPAEAITLFLKEFSD